MIHRYTLKVLPAVPHSEVLKKLDEMKGYGPDQMRKLQNVKAKVEVDLRGDRFEADHGFAKIIRTRRELHLPYTGFDCYENKSERSNYEH